MTVERLLDEASSRELSEWMARDQVKAEEAKEPSGTRPGVGTLYGGL